MTHLKAILFVESRSSRVWGLSLTPRKSRDGCAQVAKICAHADKLPPNRCEVASCWTRAKDMSQGFNYGLVSVVMSSWGNDMSVYMIMYGRFQ